MIDTVLSIFKKIAIILGIVFGSYILTRNFFTAPFKLQLALASLVIFLVYVFSVKKRDSVFFYLLTTFILFLVGATGWFFSPFFFTLYLTAIMMAFVFPPIISVGFVLALVGLFSFNIGEVDLSYDLLVVLSLLFTIPLSLYLRKEYLRLREKEKEILVLKEDKKEGKGQYGASIENILANKINNLTVNMEQPLNDIKGIAYLMGKHHASGETKKQIDRIITSSEEGLQMLKTFEKDVTSANLLSTTSK